MKYTGWVVVDDDSNEVIFYAGSEDAAINFECDHVHCHRAYQEWNGIQSQEVQQ